MVLSHQASPTIPCTSIHLCSPHMCDMTRPKFLLELITRKIFGDEYVSPSSSLCSFPKSLVTPSLLDPNLPLTYLFSNTLSLHSSFSHPNKATGNFYVFEKESWKTKILLAIISIVPQPQCALFVSPNRILTF